MDNKKIIIAIGGGVVMLVLILFMVSVSRNQNVEPVGSTNEPNQEEATQPTGQPSTLSPSSIPETGSVDDVVNQILQEATQQEAIAQEEEGDGSLVEADSAALGDFGQSVDESSF